MDYRDVMAKMMDDDDYMLEEYEREREHKSYENYGGLVFFDDEDDYYRYVDSDSYF